MIEGIVAKRYAKALFEAANEKNSLDQVEQDLQFVVKVMKDTEGFTTFLRHPRVGTDVKKETVATAFQQEISEVSQNFLYLLIDNHRMEYLEEILYQFIELANEARKVVDVEAITATALEQKDQDSIVQLLNQKLNKTVRLRNKIDPSIIGGMVVRIGDRIYDGSLQAQLQMMKKKFIDASLRS